MTLSSPDPLSPSSRVLFVDHTAKLGGAELSLLTVAEAFGPSCAVVLFEDGPFFDRLQQAGVTASVLAAPSALNTIRREGAVAAGLWALPGLLRLAWRLSRVAREYDVLVANSQKSMLVAALAGCLARRPVVWYLRDLLSDEHFGARQRGLAARTARLLVSHVIANSHASAQALLDSGGPPADRITVVHNGIDEHPFQEVSDDDVAAVRAELHLPATGVVGIFSRLSAWKGQHVLLDALRSLPNVTALLVGDALFPEDERYAARLRADIEAGELSDRVRMTGFRNDVPTLMHACDAILHTSTAPEPFGRVIVEGMMAERPVIATREGGPAEILTHGHTGLLVPAGDVGALCTAIETVLSEPEAAARMAQRGLALARASFSTQHMARAVRNVVEALSPSSPKRSPLAQEAFRPF